MPIARTLAIGTAAAGLLLVSACSSSGTTTTAGSTAAGGSGSSTTSVSGSSMPTTPGSSTPGTTTPETVTNPSEPIEATVGEEFTIVVESNPTTGYEWTITGAPADAIAKPIGSTPASSGPKPGQGGFQTFTFEATGPGTTTITLTYARSFDTADNPTVQAYTVDVTG